MSSPELTPTMPAESDRDFGSEIKELTDRAAGRPGVAEILKIYSECQHHISGLVVAARTGHPFSSAATSTSF